MMGSACSRQLAAAVAVVAAAHLGAATRASSFPPDFDRYLTNYVKLDAQGRAQLLAGEPVTRLLDSDQSKEVAVFGAGWVDAPIARVLAAARDIERVETSGAV